MSQNKNKLSPEHKQQDSLGYLQLTVNSTWIHDKGIPLSHPSHPSVEGKGVQWEPVPGYWRQLAVYSQHRISEESVVVQFCSDTWGYVIVMKK